MTLSPIDCEIRAQHADPEPIDLGDVVIGERNIHIVVRALSDAGFVQCWTFTAQIGHVEQRDATPADYDKAWQVAKELLAAIPDDWTPPRLG